MDLFEKKILENLNKSGIEECKKEFRDSEVRNCELEAYRLTECLFENDYLINSSIVRSIIDGGSIKNCGISNTTLQENGLWNLEMADCTWKDINVVAQDFVNSKLVHNNFQDQKLEVVFMNEAYLERNNFIKTEWKRLIIRRSHFVSNDFSNSKLNCRQIEYTNFENNNIAGSEWGGCSFKRCSFKNMDFRNAKFTDMEFIQCTFEECLYTEGQAILFGISK